MRSSVGLTIVAAAILLAAGAHAQKPATAPAKDKAATPAQDRFAAAVATVVHQGADAKLPPHLSVMLGVSKTEQEVAVKQRTLPSENLMRGFDVAEGNHNNVVIFVEKPEERVFYLASARGNLRKVVTIKNGTGEPQRIDPKYTQGFKLEKQVWLDILVPENPFQPKRQQ